jgi:hypothetical protein
VADVNRIKSMREVDAMVALDTFELITTRVRKLLSYGRRISMTQRYTYLSDRAPDLLVGLTVDAEARNGGITEVLKDDGAHFGVTLKPGLMTGFGFSAYDIDGNASEAEAWKRFHAGKDATAVWSKRRNMTLVRLVGGMAGDMGPARDELIVIRHWNNDAVCDERVIGFDTDAYWAEREALAEAGEFR